jgi:hypothetical protein
MSNRWCFGSLSAGSVPTTSPLRVDQGGFSRRHPTREPSVAVAASFFRSTSAAGGVTSGVVLDGCVGCRDSLSLSEFSLFEFFFLGSWQLDRFVVDGYAVVCGFIGNWFIGCVFFLERERGENC